MPFWLEDVHYDTRKRESRDLVNHLFLNDTGLKPSKKNKFAKDQILCYILLE